MRGDDEICGSLFSYIDLEKRVRADHPLRVIRQIANAALKSLSGEFHKRYSPIGRESITSSAYQSCSSSRHHDLPSQLPIGRPLPSSTNHTRQRLLPPLTRPDDL